MPNQLAGRLEFSRYYRQFSSNYAFSKETLLALSIPMLAANLLLDYGRISGAFWQWFLISLLGYLALLVVAGPIGYFFRRTQVPSALYLPTFFLIGMARGTSIYFFGSFLGVLPTGEVEYRVLGSGLYVLVMMSIFATLNSNFDRAGKSLRELESKRRSLENRLDSMKLEIAEQNSEISGRVGGLLAPVISELIQRLSASKLSEVRDQVAALRHTVENVVRPMSQSVVNTSLSLSEPGFRQSDMTLVRRLNLEMKLPLADLFLPSLSAFVLTLISLPSAIAIAGWQSGLILAVSLGLSALLILGSARYLLRDVQMGMFFSLVAHTLAHALIGLITLAAIYLVDHQLLAMFTSRLMLMVIIFGITFFVGKSRHLHLLKANEELEEVNGELEKLNAQAKQELWVNRRRIASVLHGPVQAALYASAIRLTQAKRPTKKLIQEVTDDLKDALQELNFEKSSVMPVRDVVREIIDLWSGVCTIYTSLPKSVHVATSKNVTAAETLSEVIREAVSNAIKHGGANEIEISAKVVGGVIDLQILNNGKAPTEKQASTGYGTQILNELTLSWSLNNLGDKKTLFSAEIVAGV